MSLENGPFLYAVVTFQEKKANLKYLSCTWKLSTNFNLIVN